MTNYNDFAIENNVLIKYTGKDAEITIPDGVIGIGDDAFRGCMTLMSIEIPNSVTYIGFQAFSYCSNLQNINMPDSITSIGELAFFACASLPNITIPYSVTSIGRGAFNRCSNLKSIVVSEDNGFYKNINGNLYTKDGSTLIQYSIGQGASSFDIPIGVKRIDFQAFGGCESLAQVSIPHSVGIYR